MDDDRQVAQESVATQKVEVPAPNRGESTLETGWLNRAIKDALEDDTPLSRSPVDLRAVAEMTMTAEQESPIKQPALYSRKRTTHLRVHPSPPLPDGQNLGPLLDGSENERDAWQALRWMNNRA
ncbi:hypothetical protein ACVIW2_000422 [Bradyrhizobium huanghuaihaiense]|uniref:Uncharacterized protein n=1 Tax=Bradyrhizobium daqingense TaxID=993502 RepID=A0A562LL92_9BRAD|nr:hypothetical protein IQ17_01201 [Bradyrhizobium daqingense]